MPGFTLPRAFAERFDSLAQLQYRTTTSSSVRSLRTRSASATFANTSCAGSTSSNSTPASSVTSRSFAW
jgi:hypothetical protein